MLAVLARRRVQIGFICGVLALVLATPSAETLAAGAVIALAGEGVRIWAAGHLEKGREVTTSGPYRGTRHPLYLGSALIGIGLAVASASVWVWTLVVLYLGATLTAAIRTEEAHLTEKFGAAYRDYSDGRAALEPRGFSLERAIRNREYRAATGVLVVLGVLWLKSR
jgi:protein-S-isoprenylcysteine O-methyltransferase Ste14